MVSHDADRDGRAGDSAASAADRAGDDAASAADHTDDEATGPVATAAPLIRSDPVVPVAAEAMDVPRVPYDPGAPPYDPGAPAYDPGAPAYGPGRPGARRRIRGWHVAGAVLAVVAVTATSTAIVTRLTAPPPPSAPVARAAPPASTATPGASSIPAPSTRAHASSPLPPRAAVGAVLARRATAVLRHDRAAFLADVDRSDAAFLRRQAQLYANLAQLPFTTFAYGIVGEYDSDKVKYGTKVWSPATVLRFRLTGFDTGPVAEALALTFVQRGSRWLLASDSAHDGALPAGGHAQPWDVGAIAVKQGRHVLVIGSAGDARALARLAKDADRSVAEVARTWPTGWAQKAVVIASREPRVITTYFRSALQPGTHTAAITIPVSGEVYGWLYQPPPDDGVATGDRVIMHPSVLPDIGSVALDRIMTHEFTHVATRARTGGRTPTWLVEGIAEWTSLRRYEPAVSEMPASLTATLRGKGITAFPGSATFYYTDVDAHYIVSWLLCRSIAAHYGDRKLIALYDAFGRQRRTDPVRTDEQIVVSVLGVSKAQLLRDYTRYLRGVLR